MAYPTLAECKTYMGISGASEDTKLKIYLQAAIKFVENMTGRVFVEPARYTEYNMRLVGAMIVAPRILQTPYEFQSAQWIKFPDISNDAITVSADSLLGTRPWTRVLLPRGGNSLSAYVQMGARGVTMSLKVAYSAAAPADIRLAILEAVQGMYRKGLSTLRGNEISRRNAAIGAATWVPSEVVGILSSYVRFR